MAAIDLRFKRLDFYLRYSSRLCGGNSQVKAGRNGTESLRWRGRKPRKQKRKGRWKGM